MGEKRKRKPSFMAWLPPAVRYDQELTPNAKLLYAEITALSESDGYCWGENKYLAAVFSISEQSVTRLLAQLEARGYIEQVMETNETGWSKRIWITDAGVRRLTKGRKSPGGGVLKNEETPPLKNEDRGVLKNEDRGPLKNEERGVLKNEEGHLIGERKYITPLNPPKGGRRSVHEHKDTAEWCADAFEKLWKWYPTGGVPRPAPRGNRQKAIRAWDALRPDDALIDTIAEALARQAATEQWKKGVGIPHLSTYLNNYGWEEGADGGE